MDYGTDIGYQAEPHTRHESEQELRPFDDLTAYLREYVRENPEVAAITCFGIGFILGWKLKPW
jgi:hypothetical protein